VLLPLVLLLLVRLLLVRLLLVRLLLVRLLLVRLRLVLPLGLLPLVQLLVQLLLVLLPQIRFACIAPLLLVLLLQVLLLRVLLVRLLVQLLVRLLVRQTAMCPVWMKRGLRMRQRTRPYQQMHHSRDRPTLLCRLLWVRRPLWIRRRRSNLWDQFGGQTDRHSNLCSNLVHIKAFVFLLELFAVVAFDFHAQS
jgi:hypothetical protein